MPYHRRDVWEFEKKAALRARQRHAIQKRVRRICGWIGVIGLGCALGLMLRWMGY